MIGSSKSGKTSTVEYLVSNLTKRGLSVGTAKHVHHANFTVDVEGKDTWRHAKAGATRVVCLAEDEVTVIRKELGHNFTFEETINLFQDGAFDIVVLEGFQWLISNREDVAKLVSANDVEDAERILDGLSPPIVAITGRISNDESGPIHGISVVNIMKGGEQLVDTVVEQLNLRSGD